MSIRDEVDLVYFIIVKFVSFIVLIVCNINLKINYFLIYVSKNEIYLWHEKENDLDNSLRNGIFIPCIALSSVEIYGCHD